jgi:hypothetical protein
MRLFDITGKDRRRAANAAALASTYEAAIATMNWLV